MAGQQNTIGAGKSGATSKARFGPDNPLWWVAILTGLFLCSPVGMLTFLLTIVPAQARRVRWHRLLAATAALTLLSLGLASGSLGTLIGWHATGWVTMVTGNPFGRTGLAAVNSVITLFGVPEIAVPAGLPGPWRGALMTLPLAAPAGTFAAAAYSAWARWRRQALMDLEGAAFDYDRPFGMLDEWRRRRSVAKIRAGAATNHSTGRVGIGTGRYGELVQLPTRTLISPTLIFGRNRSGKTAFTLSLLGQAATGGVIVIDFKGDQQTARFWAKWAEQHDRVFKHFTLADMDGQPYRPPTRWAPNRQACYDPLRHGNADSKTTMLQNSIAREGDAAVYFRSASEFSVIAYQVAAITGFDQDKSGFETLRQLCSVDQLVELANSTNPDTGSRYLDPADPAHRKLLDRVQSMADKSRRNEILRAALQNNETTLSQFQNGPAAGPWIRPGDTPALDIDLVEAVLNGHVVVFSLPVQSYKDVAKTIGMLAVNDLNNCVAQLRTLQRSGHTWEPAYVQIEEFGSAGAGNILDLLNKVGDVLMRVVLSTQSWSDLVAVDDGQETFARRVLSEAGNLFAFALNDGDGATVISDATVLVQRVYPRSKKEFSAGLLGMGVRSANRGEIEPTVEEGRQLSPDVVQRLGKGRRRGDTTYECIWIALSDGKRVTHTFEPHANHWSEPIATVLTPLAEWATSRGTTADSEPPTVGREKVPVAGSRPATTITDVIPTPDVATMHTVPDAAAQPATVPDPIPAEHSPAEGAAPTGPDQSWPVTRPARTDPAPEPPAPTERAVGPAPSARPRLRLVPSTPPPASTRFVRAPRPSDTRVSNSSPSTPSPVDPPLPAAPLPLAISDDVGPRPDDPFEWS